MVTGKIRVAYNTTDKYTNKPTVKTFLVEIDQLKEGLGDKFQNFLDNEPVMYDERRIEMA